MSEERQPLNQETQVHQTDAEVEAEARSQGWVPESEWRGEGGAKWIDAKTFVERGRQFLPYVNAKAKRFEGEVQDLRQQLAARDNQISALNDQVKGLVETSTEIVQSRVNEERVRLREEIKAAREAEDVDRELAATERLGKLKDPEKPAAQVKPNAGDSNAPRLDPQSAAVFEAWKSKYPSIYADPIKRAAAAHYGVELAKSGALDGLTPEQRGDRIAQEVAKYFQQAGGSRQAPVDRVGESSTRGAGNGGGGGGTGKRTYNDLPAAAREACDKQAKRIVKANTRFPTEQAYREYYTNLYFADEVA